MRRFVLLVPFLVLAISVLVATPSRAQVQPGHSGGNALSPTTDSAPAPARVIRFQHRERVPGWRVTTLGTRLQTPARVRLALVDPRLFVRFIR